VGAGDHVLGDPDAPVTLVEYGDFDCPHCGRAHPTVQEVLRRMGAAVRFVYRNFPLSQAHPHALVAAEAAEAAAAQGKFWPMHDRLFEHQDALEVDDLIGHARALGLDTARFAEDLDTHAHLEKVQADFRSGVRSGVNGTPTFFIDGARFDGSWDADTLAAALQEAVDAKR
jgi:protein-disulfide isomerase